MTTRKEHIPLASGNSTPAGSEHYTFHALVVPRFGSWVNYVKLRTRAAPFYTTSKHYVWGIHGFNKLPWGAMWKWPLPVFNKFLEHFERHCVCKTCGSTGFAASILTDQCEFCDGSFGGHPPTIEDIKDEAVREGFLNSLGEPK